MILRVMIILIGMGYNLLGYGDGLVSTNKLVDDIIRLSTNGVSEVIMKEYIKSKVGYNEVGIGEIILLKNNKVGDGIVQLLIIRDGLYKKEMSNRVNRIEYGESYEFFYNNYLMPRARYYSEKSYGIGYIRKR